MTTYTFDVRGEHKGRAILSANGDTVEAALAAALIGAEGLMFAHPPGRPGLGGYGTIDSVQSITASDTILGGKGGWRVICTGVGRPWHIAPEQRRDVELWVSVG